MRDVIALKAAWSCVLLIVPALCRAAEESPSVRAAAPLERAGKAVDAAREAPDDARWTAANEAVTALAAVMDGIVVERSRRTAAAQTCGILSNEKRIAAALVDYNKREDLEAKGYLVLAFDANDMQLIFELRGVLIRFDSVGFIEKILALPRAQAKGIVISLLTTGKAPGKTEADEELAAFFNLGREAQANGSADWDKTIESFCSAVGRWRTACPVKRVPGLIGASALACRARLAQDREEAAAKEYDAHATLLYKAFDDQEVAKQLFAEADRLRRQGRSGTARVVYLLVRGDPAKSDDAYLARLEAANCLIESGGSRGQAIEETSGVFRAGYVNAEIAAVLLRLGSGAPPEENALRVDLFKTAAGGLSGTDKAHALFMVCVTLADMGRDADARASLAELERLFPDSGYAKEAKIRIEKRAKPAPAD